MTKLIHRTAARVLALAALVLSAACTDRSPTEHAIAPGREVRAQIACTVSVADQMMRCGDPASGGAGARDIILGGQGTYVRLESGGVAYDSTAETFSLDVTVQNLLSQPMGTPDGATATGVKVFFEQLPVATEGAGEIAIANADGTGSFTRIGQPYYAYDGILEARGSTRPRTWRFDVPRSVVRFTFSVYVHTQLPVEQGALRWSQEYGLAFYCCEVFYDGVWGADSNHVWAIAFSQVLQYDGDRWTPVLDAGAFMWDVWGTSRYDVWVAGDSGKVLHYDGNRWATKRAPTAPHQVSGLWSAGSEVLAVGRYREAGGDVHGLLLRSTDGGDTWTESLSPADGRRYFRDVYRAGNDVYVVGYDSAGGAQSGLIRRSRDGGATWSDTAIAGAPNAILFAVLAEGDDVWAAGERRNGVMRTSLLLHSADRGESWSEVSMPAGVTEIHSLWRVPGGMLYAGGGSGVTRYDGTSWERMVSSRANRGVWGASDDDLHTVSQGGNQAFHWDGTSWRHVPASVGQTGPLTGVAAAEQMGVAVGNEVSTENGMLAPRAIILFEDASNEFPWTRYRMMADSSSFEDVWLADRHFAMAVGWRQAQGQRSGIVWQMDGQQHWYQATPASAAGTPLAAVWGTGPDNVYAFGVRGGGLAVLHYRGGALGWSDATVPYPGTGTPVVTGAWGSSASDIYVVGYAQTPSGSWTGMDTESFVMRWNGTTWSVAVGAGDQRRLTGVWGIGGSVFVSGHAPAASSGRWNGFVRRSDNGGGTWTQSALVAPAGDGRVNGIYGQSAQAVYAVGTRGTVYQWDGSEWTAIPGADRPDFNAISGFGGEVLAVGQWGSVFRGTR